ncbi:hypothetical protein [Methylobacterium oryzisoli]|uniref:hypothetical protein n=1 Tax=Methylobacterium oryzisoli TaxID=3385502 RepID=UPI0038922F38
MANHAAPYIFATSRIALIAERISDLRQKAEKAGTRPLIRAIHGENDDAQRGIPVLRQIADVPTLPTGEEHVVVFITHECMMQADLSHFTGWHIYIDESPAAVISNAMHVPATATYLEATYDLFPTTHSKWWRVTPKSSAPNAASIRHDDYVRDLVTFDKRARSPQGVHVNVGGWSDVKGSSMPLKWWSAWTPAELSAFKTVTIAGAGYRHSIGYKAAQAWRADELEFQTEEIAAPERSHRPRVLINYFTCHRGSTAFWKRDGEHCLSQVGDYLKNIRDLGYWSSNAHVRPYFVGAGLHGEWISPRQEGTNALMHHTSCAFIYSSKALPFDGPSMEMFGLKRSDIERAREIEDIVQFTLRGALRRSDFDGIYNVYLYDQHQANALKEYLENEGIGIADLVPVTEAGIMDVERKKPGPEKKVLDERSQEEIQERRRKANTMSKRNARAIEREQKRSAGILRPRGRPPKHWLESSGSTPKRPE